MSGLKWSRGRVIEAIRIRHAQQLPLTGVWRDWPALYRAAQTHCGSWHKAKLAADVPPQGSRRWSRERVIRELRDWYRETNAERCKMDILLAGAARYYFGSCQQALLAAGLEPRPNRTWSRARIIQTIQDRHVRGLPIQRIERRHRSLVTAARRYCGGWQGALEAAGLGDHYLVLRKPRVWNRQTVIAEIQAVSQQGLSLSQVWQADPTLYSAAKEQFGRWQTALLAAGFQPLRRTWTRQAILAEIRDRYECGQSLSSGLAANRNLAAAAHRHFGAWSTALRAAGINRKRSGKRAR